MNDRVVVLELTRMEAAHLAGLVGQFSDLLAEGATDDPAIARLVPDAYRDDPAAAREFREVTQRDLLERRSADAAVVLATLAPAAGVITAETPPHDPALMEVVQLHLDSDELQAWLRNLAALRLVLAERLGIRSEEDHDGDDARFGIYDWLGYRLDGLVRAASPS